VVGQPAADGDRGGDPGDQEDGGEEVEVQRPVRGPA
jgi:hypothetical protein